MITSLTLIDGLLGKCLGFAERPLLLLLHPAKVPRHEAPTAPLHLHYQTLAPVTAMSGIRQPVSYSTWNGVAAQQWSKGGGGMKRWSGKVWLLLLLLFL